MTVLKSWKKGESKEKFSKINNFIQEFNVLKLV